MSLSAEQDGALAAIVGAPLDEARALHGGGNNRIYRIEAGGRRYAAKLYPPRDGDPRDRFGHEVAWMRFLARHAVAAAPRLVGADRAAGLAVFDWVKAMPVTAAEAAHMEALAGFALRLAELARWAPEAAELPPAAAACLAPGDAAAQLAERRQRLETAVPGSEALARFLAEDLDPFIADMSGWSAAQLRRAGIDPTAELGKEARTLSPSDFGLHNAMQRNDGTLAFLDFEYAGWDDPAKMVSDLILNQGSAPLLDDGLRRRLLASLTPEFAARDEQFALRLRAVYPLHGLIWCMIALNEFLPDVWARRSFAGGPADREKVLAHQLEKSRLLLERLRRCHDIHVFLSGGG